MKLKIVLLGLLLSTNVFALNFIELHKNNDLDLNVSFNRFWSHNFGDALDFTMADDAEITTEIADALVKRLMETNRIIIIDNEPYIDQKEFILNQINNKTSEIINLEDDLKNCYSNRNSLHIKKRISGASTELNQIIDSNRKNIYEMENREIFLKNEIQILNINLNRLKRHIAQNNIFIRRNNSRIRFLMRNSSDNKPITIVDPIVKTCINLFLV